MTRRPKGGLRQLTFVVGIALILVAAASSRTEHTTRARAAAQPANAVERAIADIALLPGATSVLVLEDGRELGARNADTPLATGSSCKLAVLLALRTQIEAGPHRWDEVVPLDPLWKVPGDMLGTWPDGALLTLETYASFMISRSDNTATNALMAIVGRENIEPFAGRKRPLLSTKNLFFFRDLRNGALLDRYRAGDEATRRAILDQIDAQTLNFDDAIGVNVPNGLDVEWYFTNRELCSLVSRVADLPSAGIITLYDVDRIENGTAHASGDWAAAAYKGGSEPGVISVTTQVRSHDGRTVCLSAIWNNQQTIVDAGALVAIAARLLETLAAR